MKGARRAARVPRRAAGAARPLVAALAAAAPRFTPDARGEKLRLLRALAIRPIRDARTLGALHEALCFLQAYPDDAAVLAAIDEALEAIPARVRRLGSGQRRRLGDSGIAGGTTIDYPYGRPMARWLAEHFPLDVEVRWPAFTGGERLQDALDLLLEPAERDAASDEGGLGFRRWIEAARGARRITDLGVLLEVVGRAALDEPARDWLFESLDLPLRWRLRARDASRTFARLPWRAPFFHGPAGAVAPRRPTPRELIREATRPLPGLRPAPRALAAQLIRASRLAMATRLRELFAFSHANPADVLVADPGRGLRIALIGIRPEFRLPLEGYYAYLALKNGVPVGYGAGWQLAGTTEIAVNVFEPYRGGESALILAQVLRAYRRVFASEAVSVDPYQIGHGNREALAAGAFYFYYRLGFRPTDPRVRRLARGEQRKIDRDPAYRSSPAVLRALARSPMRLDLSRARASGVAASQLAALVTDDVARRYGGRRRAAARGSLALVERALGVRGRARWPPAERWAFERLSPVVALIPGLDRWPARDRRRLVDVLRAKGGPSEARYVRLLALHRRLRRSLEALAAGRPRGRRRAN